MKPLSLSMQAFGSFAGTEVLDFRLLGNASLFLIHGPTGAGKTTILDAICFALFGEPTGEDRVKAKYVRSDLAADDLETKVVLDFALGEKRYRIARLPRQLVTGKRGKPTEKGPEASLWDRTDCLDDADEGHVIATGKDKVDAAIEPLIAFTAGQFRQIICIPQGEFRKVLTSDDKERQEILKKLFDIQFCSKLTAALDKRGKDAVGAHKLASEKVKTLLSSSDVADLAGLLKQREMSSKRSRRRSGRSSSRKKCKSRRARQR